MTKITVHLFATMYADFDQQMKDLNLQRDAFLDRIVANELIARQLLSRQTELAANPGGRTLIEAGVETVGEVGSAAQEKAEDRWRYEKPRVWWAPMSSNRAPSCLTMK